MHKEDYLQMEEHMHVWLKSEKNELNLGGGKDFHWFKTLK